MTRLHENEFAHLADFVRLNRAWITRYFQLEPPDYELFARPEAIFEQGGYILSLTLDDQVIGVCALLREDAETFELAKMAVAEEFLGRGYSNLLMEAAIQKAREQGARKIMLITNSQLTPALAVYRKFGFVTTHEGADSGYSRGDVIMEKPL